MGFKDVKDRRVHTGDNCAGHGLFSRRGRSPVLSGVLVKKASNYDRFRKDSQRNQRKCALPCTL